MELSDVKRMIRETLEENNNEDLMEILMEKMDMKIMNNNEFLPSFFN
jgi:transcription termination factor Rho